MVAEVSNGGCPHCATLSEHNGRFKWVRTFGRDVLRVESERRHGSLTCQSGQSSQQSASSVLFQRGVQRPASKCDLELVMLPSNRPARTSSSIFRSHWSARNSSNHCEKRESSSADRRETTDSSSSTLMVTQYTLGHQIKRKDFRGSKSVGGSASEVKGMGMPRKPLDWGGRI